VQHARKEPSYFLASGPDARSQEIHEPCRNCIGPKLHRPNDGQAEALASRQGRPAGRPELDGLFRQRRGGSLNQRIYFAIVAVRAAS
jgi:hypothetical protein